MTKQTQRKNYDEDDHKKAYDAYYVSRNLSDVQRTIGLAYDTVLRWSQDGYACPHGCPWHGWNTRIEEELRVLAAKNQVAAQGITDPVKQADAMLDALEKEPLLPVGAPPTKQEISYALAQINTEKERLHQWKLLRAKVYFSLTGVPLDYETLQGASLTGPHEKALGEELFKKGLNPTNFEQTVRTLGYIDEQIEKLEARMRGEAANTITTTLKVKDPAPSLDSMSPEALRTLIELSEKLPASGLKQVVDAVGVENPDDACGPDGV